MTELNFNNNIKYLLNKNEMTVKFLKKIGWSINLQPFDSFLSPFYVPSSFVFKYDNEGGKFDLDRFLDALHQTLESFYFMLSTYKKDENGKVIACYKPNDEEFQKDILEIENREEESIDDIKDYNSTLPYKIVSDIVKGDRVLDLTNQRIVFLKLTIQKDGFIIGYCFNHGLFDHSSIYYFFKYLSNCYTYGSCNGLKEPYLADSLKFLNENLKFNHLKDAIKFQDDNLGYGSYTNNENQSQNNESEKEKQNNKHLKDNTVIQLIFNSKDITQFKGNHIISRNDIITSCLLKILTFTPLLNDDEIFNLKYICNYRKYFNYDESAIGNFAINKSHKFKIKDIRSMSVLELSLYNRNNVISKNCEKDFKDALSWFKYNQDRNENVLNYSSHNSFYYSLLNNLIGFNYETIKFDNIVPKSLVAPSVFATFGLNVISFENESNNNETINYTMNISIPKNCIPKILEFSQSNNLFKVKDLS